MPAQPIVPSWSNGAILVPCIVDWLSDCRGGVFSNLCGASAEGPAVSFLIFSPWTDIYDKDRIIVFRYSVYSQTTTLHTG
jgi:hypothetical protein